LKKKGVVLGVTTGFVAELRIITTGDVLSVDQRELQTVIPQPGCKVLIIKGPFKGIETTLTGINIDRFQVEVRFASGTNLWMNFGDVSKFRAPNNI